MRNQRPHMHTDRRQFPPVSALRGKPQASACLKGDLLHPDLKGLVQFYQTEFGVLIYAEVEGLPQERMPCTGSIFAFHIHEGTQCTGNASDPFANASTHYNPGSCPHPYHAGDLPPLFGNHGYALQAVLTDRFAVEEVIGRTVIIHDRPDDFTTQPSGNAGSKIACGLIQRN